MSWSDRFDHQPDHLRNAPVDLDQVEVPEFGEITIEIIKEIKIFLPSVHSIRSLPAV